MSKTASHLVVYTVVYELVCLKHPTPLFLSSETQCSKAFHVLSQRSGAEMTASGRDVEAFNEAT